MPEAIIITPVKDSLETTKQTIEAISKAEGDFEYYIFNDFSTDATKKFLEEAQQKFNYKLINLEDITSTPSPNYKLVLETAQKMALEKKCPLIVIESDVIIQPKTITSLFSILKSEKKPGIVGAITVDKNGNYNFPYTFEKIKSNTVLNTSHSLSFCCTLLSNEFLEQFSFTNLSEKKDWYDIYISRQSKKMGFNNYLAKGIEVIHLPHSSRPWKQLKYKNPILYYIRKYLKKRDKI